MSTTLRVTIATTWSSGRPSASIAVMALASEKRTLPKNMCSVSLCTAGVPGGAGTCVL